MIRLLTVCPVGLLDAAVVGDVLSLRVDAVEAEAEARDLVVAVLLDDAARLPQVRGLRRRLPPVHQITCKLIGDESLILSFSDLARVTKKSQDFLCRAQFRVIPPYFARKQHFLADFSRATL